MRISPKILVADDDQGIIDSTVMMLEIMGYDVTSTLDGSTLLRDFSDKPDLIILDIWMAGVDGRDICRSLKAEPDTESIPVLMMSAGNGIKQSAMDSGANDFLEKPFDLEELIEKVEQLVA